jgi:hypothetical protein
MIRLCKALHAAAESEQYDTSRKDWVPGDVLLPQLLMRRLLLTPDREAVSVVTSC